MPNVNLTKEELIMIEQGLKAEITSAQRAQKTSKAPQIGEIYKLLEAQYSELQSKIKKAAYGKE